MAKKTAKAAKPKAEKKPKEPKQKSVTVPKFIKDHYEEIKAKEREVREQELAYETKAACAKTAKKLFEESDLELRNMIARGPDRQLKLPLGTKKKGEVDTSAPAAVAAPIGLFEVGKELDVTQEPGGDVTYKGDDSTLLVLQAGDFEAIGWNEPTPAATNDSWRKAPIKELGLTGKKEWPKGIGNGKVTMIEDAVVGWLTKNRDKFGQPETTAA